SESVRATRTIEEAKNDEFQVTGKYHLHGLVGWRIRGEYICCGHRYGRQGSAREGTSVEARLFTLRGTQFPHAATVRRYALAHGVLAGRRGLWRTLDTEGRLPIRSRRGDPFQYW